MWAGLLTVGYCYKLNHDPQTSGCDILGGTFEEGSSERSLLGVGSGPVGRRPHKQRGSDTLPCGRPQRALRGGARPPRSLPACASTSVSSPRNRGHGGLDTQPHAQVSESVQTAMVTPQSLMSLSAGVDV